MSCLTTNTTYTLLASADRLGVNFFSTIPLEQLLYNSFRAHILLINTVTMGIQLFALVAPPFLPAIRVMLLVYDPIGRRRARGTS